MKALISVCILSGLILVLATGCGSSEKKGEDGFFTSGSRDADQRAEQRIAKDEQLKGKDNAGDEKKSEKQTLFARLGGEQGMTAIVDDFVNRALADPRVNFERKGVTRGGFNLHRNQSVEWKPTPDAVAKMKKHMVQFFTLATGGPTKYEGGEMSQVHKGMHISNSEFDAAVGDLKSTLDKLHIATADQKELLAIVESTRLQVVEKR
jgi:hemoglobin